ncbi:hypothetical protein [uncultured Amnibacterium sp.]|uniref:hypothetical protein n=1 Tax=uncultured Amnibacterium sp. TaxID=1631851 RepID=UPI0035C98E22
MGRFGSQHDGARAGGTRSTGSRLPSPEAILLHTLGLIAAIGGRGEGRIGCRDAERLAQRCGAAISELVAAGFWIRVEAGYPVRAGALAEAWADTEVWADEAFAPERRSGRWDGAGGMLPGLRREGVRRLRT